MRLPSSRCLVIVAVPLALSACATVVYQNGLIFRKSPDFNYVEGFGGSRGFVEARGEGLALRIETMPDYDYLTFSPPVLPVPIIPWPPGIYGVAAHPERYRLSAQRLSIQVSFGNPAYRSDHRPSIESDGSSALTDLVFSPDDFKLLVGSTTLTPANVVWSYGGCAADKGCGVLPGGRYSISYGMLTQDYRDPSCTLTYDVVAAGIKTAVLKIQNASFSGKKKELSADIVPASFHLGAIGP